MYSKEEKRKKFEEDFDSCVFLGLNPLSMAYTISGTLIDEYKMYAKSRINVIKRGEDLVYKIKEIIDYKIIKIKK